MSVELTLGVRLETLRLVGQMRRYYYLLEGYGHLLDPCVMVDATEVDGHVERLYRLIVGAAGEAMDHETMLDEVEEVVGAPPR